jgi:hydroxymethylpyrimidine pyrophosphatase-like HAD family hydrolase
VGKPFQLELEKLPTTYEWACDVDVEDLRRFVSSAQGTPLFAVGSGGSHSAAYLAALLHENCGMFAKSVTPYQLVSSNICLDKSSILILSAGGRNSDTLSAFRFAAIAEPRQLHALCTTLGSPLRRLSQDYSYSQVSEYDIPSGKDGFLATNSLLAFSTLLLRAYAIGTSSEVLVPADLVSPPATYLYLQERIESLLERRTWLVLHGGWGTPAAIDIESKFSEAALGNIQLADFRNFAHGRHHWLAKRAAESAVLALVGPTEAKIAQRTLELLPSSLPVAQITTDRKGPTGSLDLLVSGYYLTYFAGLARGIDPGKPGVPTFGSRIYNLRIPSSNTSISTQVALPKNLVSAVGRKLGCSVMHCSNEADILRWRQAYTRFVRRLQASTFGSIVFDYDGTLCKPSERYRGISAIVAKELEQLLKDGLLLGIATGRGKSVRQDLQEKINPAYSSQMLVGYYNGAIIASLGDQGAPDVSGPMDPNLFSLMQSLERDSQFVKIAKCDSRPTQLTIEASQAGSWELTKAIVSDIVGKSAFRGVQVLESGHSIDVIAQGVSKLNLVYACSQLAVSSGRSKNVLCIGDSGRWPGNDYGLLSTPYSLSVDTVSPDMESCWNLSRAGIRGVQATLEYLRNIVPSNQNFNFKMKGARG